jgi:hypothetical protein
MQLPFPTNTYSLQRAQNIHAETLYRGRKLHQRKTSTQRPQNVEKMHHQRKISTQNPQIMEEIPHQPKTSTQNPQNVEKMPHLHKKRQPQRAAFSLYLSGRN